MCEEEEPLTSSDGSVVNVRRTRRPHPASRAGCLTCKRRHVKCDERTPTCLRCERAGKECLGYGKETKSTQPREETKQFKMIHYHAPFPVKAERRFVENGAEAYMLHWFSSQTLRLLQQGSPSSFWSMDLSKLDKGPLRDVALATASQHLDFEEAQQGSVVARDRPQWYTKAVSSLRASIMAQNCDIETVFACCLMFVLYESLCHRPNNMLTHLDSGLRLLNDRASALGDSHGADAILARLGFNTFLYRLRDLPTREQAAARREMMEASTADLSRLTPASVSEEVDIAAATTTAQVINFIIQISAGVADRSSENLANMELLIQKNLELLRDSQDQMDSAGRWHVLYARALLNKVLLRGSLPRYQTSYDVYRRDFAEAVAHLEDGLLKLYYPDATCIDESLKRPTFSLDLGIIGALTIIVSQCRDPATRRRALRLLRVCPLREGLWDAAESFAIGEKLIDFEETSSDNYDEQGVCVFVPEQHRVHMTALMHPCEANSFKKLVVFTTKPNNDLLSSAKHTFYL